MKKGESGARAVTSDLSNRPFAAKVERGLRVSPHLVYSAFTTEWERWFAMPGAAWVEPDRGRPFFFETEHNNQRHPHYGRYLRLEPHRLVELTWVTGKAGTQGAETILTVEIIPSDKGSSVKLIHAGFYDEAAARQHQDAWQGPVLDHLERRFAEKQLP